jgi:hypothetical protein
MTTTDLQALPNVGAAVSAMLVRVGIEHPDDLADWTAETLFEKVCAVDGRRHDPCLLDTFAAVIDHVNGAPPHPWWHYSRHRKEGVAR